MLYVNIIFIFLFSLAYIISVKKYGYLLKEANKKEHKLYFFYPLAHHITSKYHLDRFLSQRVKVTKAVRALNLTGKDETHQRLYWYNKISLVFFVLFLFNLLSLMTALQSRDDTLVNNQYIIRPKVGEGSREVELEVTGSNIGSNSDKKKDSLSKEEIFKEELTITVKEREYTEEEFEEVLELVIPYLEEAVLGDNASASEIKNNLNFISQIPGTRISVDWYPEDTSLISGEGIIKNDKLELSGVNTTITAMLTYGDKKIRHTIPFTILPKEISEKEAIIDALNEKIIESAEKTKKEEKLILPDQVGEYTLTWRIKTENYGLILTVLGIMTAILVWVYNDKELDKRMKQRNDQMLLDYPEIINKFTLLINAGMTIKQAWIKITEDYLKKGDKKKGSKRYAYEEMLMTAHELKLGTPEGSAYERFGKRAGLMPYLKFSSLITQNLKKGNKGLIESLQHEAAQAFEERKELAKRLGEEAGTKLLIPMMLMLILVLIIIMIPAFLSMRV